MMLYNTQNQRVSGLHPSSGFLKIRRLDLFLASGDVRETSILLSSLETANVNHWTSALLVGFANHQLKYMAILNTFHKLSL
jgi:hypothetical protein